jgi:hypothetical protein
MVGVDINQLGCRFLFSGIHFVGAQKQKKTGFLGIFFFPVFSGGIFHRNVVLERLQEFRFLDAITGIFRRNSCGTRIPVFSPDSSGIPVPAKSCLA